MPVRPFAYSRDEASEEGASSRPSADESLVELRCSVLVTRGRDVLLIKRITGSGRDRRKHWVLSGGPPRGLVGGTGDEPAWMGVSALRDVALRPPIAGFLLSGVNGQAPTIPYLRNLWRDHGASG